MRRRRSIWPLRSTACCNVLGKPRLLERVGQVRDAAAAALGDAWNHARFEAARTRIEQQLAGGRLREAFEGAQQLLQRARAAGEQAYPGADYDLAMACWLLARVLKTAGGSEQALPLLDEARQRFEAVAKERANKAAEGMASVCFAEQGDCLLYLGRLDEAAAAYEESIRRGEQLGDDRQVAVGKGQLGTVRMQQRRYPEALAAYAEARERFTQLDEPGSVAVIWHQTGMVYQEAGQPEAAEDAYRKSLAIKVRLGDVAGQASTLINWESCMTMSSAAPRKPWPSSAKRRTSMSKSVTWRTKGRRGAISPFACASSAALTKRGRKSAGLSNATRSSATRLSRGRSWAILADIETDAGNPAAAAEAKGKAIACYLAYRRDGGENHDAPGRIALAVTQSLLAGAPAQAASLLQQLRRRLRAAWLLRLHPRPPSHRRRPPRPHPRRRPGFVLRDGRRNPLPDRNAGKVPVVPALRVPLCDEMEPCFASRSGGLRPRRTPTEGLPKRGAWRELGKREDDRRCFGFR